MILSSAFVSALLLISAPNVVHAAPRAHAKRAPEPVTLPLVRRGAGVPDHTPEEWNALASARKAKYGGGSAEDKRALVTVSTTNDQADTSYFAVIDVGSPPKPFNVILDTGSAYVYFFCILDGRPFD